MDSSPEKPKKDGKIKLRIEPQILRAMKKQGFTRVAPGYRGQYCFTPEGVVWVGKILLEAEKLNESIPNKLS